MEAIVHTVIECPECKKFVPVDMSCAREMLFDEIDEDPNLKSYTVIPEMKALLCPYCEQLLVVQGELILSTSVYRMVSPDA